MRLFTTTSHTAKETLHTTPYCNDFVSTYIEYGVVPEDPRDVDLLIDELFVMGYLSSKTCEIHRMPQAYRPLKLSCDWARRALNSNAGIVELTQQRFDSLRPVTLDEKKMLGWRVVPSNVMKALSNLSLGENSNGGAAPSPAWRSVTLDGVKKLNPNIKQLLSFTKEALIDGKGVLLAGGAVFQLLHGKGSTISTCSCSA